MNPIWIWFEINFSCALWRGYMKQAFRLHKWKNKYIKYGQWPLLVASFPTNSLSCEILSFFISFNPPFYFLTYLIYLIFIHCKIYFAVLYFVKLLFIYLLFSFIKIITINIECEMKISLKELLKILKFAKRMQTSFMLYEVVKRIPIARLFIYAHIVFLLLKILSRFF